MVLAALLHKMKAAIPPMLISRAMPTKALLCKTVMATLRPYRKPAMMRATSFSLVRLMSQM
jgi:hypothetical protein